MIGNLAQTAINFTDTAFLGHLGRVELGAASMAGIYYFVFTTLAMGFAVGIQIIIARRLGEGRLAEIGAVFQHGAIFVFLLGLVLLLLLYFITGGLLRIIISSPNIYALSIEYMRYRQFGIVFVCFNYLFRSLYVGLSNTKVITYSTLIMAGVNILLDYVLIFGNWGFPAMGIGGAALGSLCAEISATLFFFVVTYFSLRRKDYGLFRRHSIRPSLFRSILHISTPTMAQRLVSMGVWFAFFIFVEKMGELNMAISSVTRSLYLVLSIPTFGFNVTASTLTSRLIGAGRAKEVMSMLHKTAVNCLLCSIPAALLCVAAPELVIRIYTSDSTVIAGTFVPLIMVVVAILASSISMVYFEAISGTGNTHHAFFLELGVLAIYITYVICATTMQDRIGIVWISEILYNSLMGVVALVYMHRARWLKTI